MSLCASSVFRLFLTTLLIVLPRIVEIESSAVSALVSSNEENYKRNISADPEFPQEAEYGKAQLYTIPHNKTISSLLKPGDQGTRNSTPLLTRDIQSDITSTELTVTTYVPSDKRESMSYAKNFTDSLDNVAIEPDETIQSKTHTVTERLKVVTDAVTTTQTNSETPNQNTMTYARPTESNIYSFTTKRSRFGTTSKQNNKTATTSKPKNKPLPQISTTPLTRTIVDAVTEEVTTEQLVISTTVVSVSRTRPLKPEYYETNINNTRKLETSTNHSIKTDHPFITTESESVQIISKEQTPEFMFKRKDENNSIESGEQGQKGQSQIYKVNSNYKRYKKLNIVPSKPFRRDPNDNSWRNESISSLGIKFKPKTNTTKGFQFRKKALNELDALIGETENTTGPGLRERLEKLSELRKSKKKLLANTSIEMSGEEFDYENSSDDFLRVKTDDVDAHTENKSDGKTTQNLPRISQNIKKKLNKDDEKVIENSYYQGKKLVQTDATDKTKETQVDHTEQLRVHEKSNSYSDYQPTGLKKILKIMTGQRSKSAEKVKANQFDYETETESEKYEDYDHYDIKITEHILNSTESWSDKKPHKTTNTNNKPYSRTTDSSVIKTTIILDPLEDYVRTTNLNSTESWSDKKPHKTTNTNNNTYSRTTESSVIKTTIILDPLKDYVRTTNLNLTESWSDKKPHKTTNTNNKPYSRTTDSSVIKTTRIFDPLEDYLRTTKRYDASLVKEKAQVQTATPTERNRVHQHLTEKILQPSEQTFVSKSIKQVENSKNNRNNDDASVPHSYSYNTIQHKSSPVHYNTSVIHLTTTVNPDNYNQQEIDFTYKPAASRENIAKHKVKIENISHTSIIPKITYQELPHISNPAQIDQFITNDGIKTIDYINKGNELPDNIHPESMYANIYNQTPIHDNRANHRPTNSRIANHESSNNFVNISPAHDNILNHTPVFQNTGNDGTIIKELLNHGSTLQNFPKHTSILETFNNHGSTTAENISNEGFNIGNILTHGVAHPSIAINRPKHVDQSGTSYPDGIDQDTIHKIMNYQSEGSIIGNIVTHSVAHPNIAFNGPKHVDKSMTSFPNGIDRNPIHENMNYQGPSIEKFINYGPTTPKFVNLGPINLGHESYASTLSNIATHRPFKNNHNNDVSHQGTASKHFVDDRPANPNARNPGSVHHKNYATTHPNIANLESMHQTVVNQETFIKHFIDNESTSELFVDPDFIQHGIGRETYAPTHSKIASLRYVNKNVGTRIDNFFSHTPTEPKMVHHHHLSESHRHMLDNGQTVSGNVDQIPIQANIGNHGSMLANIANHEQMAMNIKQEETLPVLYNNTFIHATDDQGYDATSSSAYLKRLYDQLGSKSKVRHEHKEGCHHDAVELAPEYQLNYYVRGGKS